MEKKKKPTIYIKGNIVVHNTLAVGGGKLETFLAEEDIDISECVVIEGDLTLDSFVVYGGFVAVSGEVQKGG